MNTAYVLLALQAALGVLNVVLALRLAAIPHHPKNGQTLALLRSANRGRSASRSACSSRTPIPGGVSVDGSLASPGSKPSSRHHRGAQR